MKHIAQNRIDSSRLPVRDLLAGDWSCRGWIDTHIDSKPGL